MICWLLLYGATDQKLQKSQWVACFLLDLNAKGIKTIGKSKRELKILCKHEVNCEREMKVLGKESKGNIAGLAGTRMDWPNKQCRQIGTYRKRKQCFRHHQSIHKPAPPDVNIATSTSSMKKLMGGACEENRGWGFLDANVLGWTCRWRHWVTWASYAAKG